MPITRSQWVSDKTDTALCLYNGSCGGGYNEAIIILSATISSLAAEVWPGEYKDKKRFVELIVSYCNPGLNSSFISLPLLIQHLELMAKAAKSGALVKENLLEQASILREKFINYNDFQVLRARDTDKSEMEVLDVCPNLPTKILRKYSYPSIFYEEVRSRLVHEYKTGEKTDSWAVAATDEDEISYGNWRRNPLVDNRPIRRIHFPIHWLISIAKSVAESVDLKPPKDPLEDPRAWWLSGG